MVGGILGEAEFSEVLIPRSMVVTNIGYNHGLKYSIHALDRIGLGLIRGGGGANIVFVSKRTQCTINVLGAVVREKNLGGSPSVNHEF